MLLFARNGLRMSSGRCNDATAFLANYHKSIRHILLCHLFQPVTFDEGEEEGEGDDDSALGAAAHGNCR